VEVGSWRAALGGVSATGTGEVSLAGSILREFVAAFGKVVALGISALYTSGCYRTASSIVILSLCALLLAVDTVSVTSKVSAASGISIDSQSWQVSELSASVISATSWSLSVAACCNTVIVEILSVLTLIQSVGAIETRKVISACGVSCNPDLDSVNSVCTSVVYASCRSDALTSAGVEVGSLRARLGGVFARGTGEVSCAGSILGEFVAALGKVGAFRI